MKDHIEARAEHVQMVFAWKGPRSLLRRLHWPSMTVIRTDILNMQEAAHLLRIKPCDLRDLAEAGEIPFISYPHKPMKKFFRVQHLLDYVDGRICWRRPIYKREFAPEEEEEFLCVQEEIMYHEKHAKQSARERTDMEKEVGTLDAGQYGDEPVWEDGDGNADAVQRDRDEPSGPSPVAGESDAGPEGRFDGDRGQDDAVHGGREQATARMTGDSPRREERHGH